MDNSKRFSIWLAWLLVSLFYAYQYILRVLPNIIMPEVMQRFHINADIFGQFAGIYYIAYASIHIPIGIWLDHKGPRYILPICILLTVLGTLPLLYSDSWLLACVGRVLIGMGSSAAILGLFKVVHLGFPADKFSRMLGSGVTIGLVGAIYGSRPVSELIIAHGYKTTIEYILYIGVVLAAVSFVIMPKAKGVARGGVSFSQEFTELWQRKKIFLISIFAGLMIAPLEGFADAWGVQFLQTVYMMAKTEAAFLTSLIFMGMAVGATLIPYVADKTKCYYGIIIAAAFVMGSIFLALLLFRLSFEIVRVLLFTVGILSAYQILSVYKATTYVKEELIGISTATVNMIMMLFGYLFHTVIGKTIDMTWDGAAVNGIPVYSGDSFVYGIAIIPLGLIVGGLGFLWIRKKP